MEVGIRELKAKASEIVSRAEAGEEVVITRRGKRVARIVPQVPDGIDPRMAELIASGRVRWGGRRPAIPEPITFTGEGPTAAEMVLEDRR